MIPNSSLDNLVDEILAAWRDFATTDDYKKLGRTLQELLDMAASFCKERKWVKARQCCEMGSEVLALGWDQRGRMDVGLAEAAVMFSLATTYLGQNKVEAALDYYKKSGDAFNGKMAWMAAAILWFDVGKVCTFQSEWAKAMWAFQRSLNMLENLPARSQKADEFREKIEPEFMRAKDGLNKSLRASARAPRKTEATADEERMGIRKLFIVREIAAGPGYVTGEAVLEASLTEENVIDTVTIDSAHLKGADIGFKVNGESMTDAGILEGDYALVRLVNVAENGETVVALIKPIGEGGEWSEATLKKYYKEESEHPHHRLQPMNSAMSPIIVAPPGTDLKAIESVYLSRGIQTTPKLGEVEIIGKLVAIWRKSEK